MKIRTYSELDDLPTFAARFHYLSLPGEVGASTFGFDRHINQAFYRSRQWKHIRNYVIARDLGNDLGIEGYEINGELLIHHINPINVKDIVDGDPDILDPEFLITTTMRTHNAIHFGDERQLPRPFVERQPGDTRLWEPTTRRSYERA